MQPSRRSAQDGADPIEPCDSCVSREAPTTPLEGVARGAAPCVTIRQQSSDDTSVTTSGERLAGLEFERKFVIPRTRLEPTLRCLAALTRRDERFPDGIVSSIYYDTPSFRLLHEKIDSHLYKTKVRLRWYEDPSLGPVDETSFLELKSRVGLRRSKRRLSTSLMASFLSAAPLTDPAIQEIPSLLPNDPTVSPRGLAPVLVLRYRRRRYLDPLTGSRISLDTRISIGRTNPRLLAGGAHAVLPQLILEIKNSTGRVPVNLHFLRALDAEATSFSKYHAGFAALAVSPGRAA